MGMKLLSPFSQKDKQQEEQVRKIMRIQEVEELATKTNAKLARAEADFNDTLARNRAKWALEEEEHNKSIKDKMSEVEALESRKKQALIPISMYKKEADKIMEQAKEILARAKGKEEQADYLTEKLEEKLTAVADREYAVEREESRQKVAKEGLEAQQEQTKQGAEQLSKEIVKFNSRKEQEESGIEKRKKEVALAEISFNAKVEKYKRDFEALKIWHTQLKDERATLDREYARR